MEPVTKVLLLDDEGERFFGEGPYRLLCAVETEGSLRAAAASMGMAYTKALRLVRHAEEALGFPLTQRTTGGRDGGGSRLTPRGKEFLDKYAAYREQCTQACRGIYCQVFGSQR